MVRRLTLILGLAGALLFDASVAHAQRLLVVNCDDGELRSWPGWVQVDTVSSAAFLGLGDAQLHAYAAIEISHCIDANLRSAEARRKVTRAVREGVSLYVTSFGVDIPFVPGAVSPSGDDACEDAVTVPTSAYGHPIVTFPTPDLRGSDLSNVGCALHGSFTSVSAEYQTIAVSGTTSRPVMLAGTFSCGRVFIRSHQFHSTTEARAVTFTDSVARWLVSPPAGYGIDSDGDGIDNVCDDCPVVPNANQSDCNGNGLGDACDPAAFDYDHDGIDDACDSCPLRANTEQPLDSDGDGVDDACDNCPSVPNVSQADCNNDGLGDACDADRDGDRVPDRCDNCPNDFNPLQRDHGPSPDGIGDACEVIHGFYDDTYFHDVTLSNIDIDQNQIGLHSLQVFRGSAGTEKYPVLDFSLRDVPANAKVQQAYLDLFQTVKVPGQITMHFVLAPWREDQTTWRSFGGAYDPHVISRLDSVQAESDRRVRFDSTEALRAWLSGDRPNYGLLLRAVGLNITRFGSIRRALVERRPNMYVDYTVPEPALVLLAAEGPESPSGMIYAVNAGTGQTTPWGRVGRGVRGLATKSDGTLWATAVDTDGSGALVSIASATGVGTTVGPLVGGRRLFPAMSDCTFTSRLLYCWSELDDELTIVDEETGEVNLVGGGVWSFGTGLAADRDGMLWLAPHGARGELYTVDPHTGRVTMAATLRGSLDAITAMTFSDGVLYAIEANETTKQLVRIDRTTGAVTPIVTLPRLVSSLATFGWSP